MSVLCIDMHDIDIYLLHIKIRYCSIVIVGPNILRNAIAL